MRPSPLPPFYYLTHFSTVLRRLLERDHDLLTSAERDFIDGFFALPCQAQALIARIAPRSKAILEKGSLRYPELSGLNQSLTILQSHGWIDADPTVTMSQLFASLPLSRLLIGFRLKPNRPVNKQRMLQQAQDMYPVPTPLSSTHFRIDEPLYQFAHAGLCRRLCAQYFGNHHQDWSQFIIADRGIRQYECVAFDAASRPFQIRVEIDTFHALQKCLETLESPVSATQALALLPEVPVSCDWLHARHRLVAFRLARRLEREGEVDAALSLYRAIGSTDASGREALLARRLSGERRARGRSRREVPHFDLSLSAVSTQKIERRVAQELHRLDPASEVQVVENRLFNALFGLLFWRALFAPVRGAFFHAFQAAPADLDSEHFCEQRRALFDESLEALRSGDYRRSMRETFAAKAGVSNPWVGWQWLRPSTLERALACIPAQHLLVIFQWMLGDLRRRTTGYPDLIQYWPDECRYRLLEVKLGADRLQDNQRQFLQYAISHDLPINVCYVTAPTLSRPASARKVLNAASANLSLDLFQAQDTASCAR